MNVNERAAEAANNEPEFERLVEEYRPFIATCASKVAGRRIDTHDDEMSVALIAFSEAVKRYRPQSGQFLMFASNVIRSRLIDYFRESDRRVDSISLDTDENADGAAKSTDVLQYQLRDTAPQTRYDDPLKLEIEALTQDLLKYGFTFMDVAKCSPKSVKTKAACKKVTGVLIGSPDLIAALKSSRQLPMKQLEKKSGISQKIISRHRNYIVCLVEILSGEYEYLAEYVKLDRKGDQQ